MLSRTNIKLMVVARFLGHLGASLLSDCGTAGLRFVYSVSDWNLLALLPGNLVTYLSGHLSLYLVLDSVAFLFRFVLCDLE